jgi:hypothetical protein
LGLHPPRDRTSLRGPCGSDESPHLPFGNHGDSRECRFFKEEDHWERECPQGFQGEPSQQVVPLVEGNKTEGAKELLSIINMNSSGRKKADLVLIQEPPWS